MQPSASPVGEDLYEPQLNCTGSNRSQSQSLLGATSLHLREGTELHARQNRQPSTPLAAVGRPSRTGISRGAQPDSRSPDSGFDRICPGMALLRDLFT